MKRSINALVFGAALIAATPAMATANNPAMTGNDVLQRCTSKSFVTRIACHFYVLGIADALGSGMVTQKPACIPVGVHSSQLADIVVTYLRGPGAKERHLWAGTQIVRAYAETWPCKPAEEKKAANAGGAQ